MTLGLYFDHHMPRAVALALRARGIIVITAEDDSAKHLRDEDLLERASALGFVLMTNDRDFTSIAAAWQRSGRPFSGVAYVPRQGTAYGTLIADLHLLAEGYRSEEIANRVEYLPL